MKKTANRLLIALIFFGIIVSTFWLWYSYKPKVQTTIPVFADSIVSVDVTNLRNELLKNYLKDGNIDSKGLFDIRKIGLQIPDYLIGFTSHDTNPHTFFTSFSISDSSLFNVWKEELVSQHGFELSSSETLQHFVSASGKLTVSVNLTKNTLLLSFGLNAKPSQIKAVCHSVFLKEQLMKQEDELITRIRDNEKIGYIWLDKNRVLEKQSELFLELIDHNFVLSGDLFLEEEFRFPTQSHQSKPESYFQFNIANGESQLIQEFFNLIPDNSFTKLAGFSLDSIQRFHPTEIEFSLHPPSIKLDTSIQYEFDEDFNPIEVKKVSELKTPNFSLSIQFEKEGVLPYLLQNGSAKLMDEAVIFTAFPFAKVAVEKIENKWVFATKKVEKPNPELTTHFLSGYADFSQLDSTYLNFFQIENSLIENRKIKILGTQNQEKTSLNISLSY